MTYAGSEEIGCTTMNVSTTQPGACEPPTSFDAHRRPSTAIPSRCARAGIVNSPANPRVNATVPPVTPLAAASAAPVRPARYALRWAGLN